ncbi:hypothetical protein [Pseudooceanicola marinus]|uniref:hypothetical protein n=1 Tax=Pseudooceanicola marinus TaxID=396013 RepID=UPI000A26EEC7|nr:hypothetical protein [Pseudooceanicola marinus]MCA1336982.1 hypothetical protein [Pseudooceanicola marinus]PJE33386.1 hypothetical protein CVM50_03910 [Pseudooceanicola marinus]
MGAVLMLAGGLAGGIISAYAYFTPLTGVSGTPGALLVILSSVLIFLASLIVALVGSRAWRNVLRVLLVLGIVLTGIAGLFLLQPMLTAAMAVALVGWIIDCAQPARAARAREGAIA